MGKQEGLLSAPAGLEHKAVCSEIAWAFLAAKHDCSDRG